MSAFVVDDAHIDLLVQAGCDLPPASEPLRWFWPPLDATTDSGSWTSEQLATQAHERVRHLRRRDQDECDRVGRLLLATNYDSVNHRYDEMDAEAIAAIDSYRHRRFNGMVEASHAGSVIGAIRTYRYQACEHPGWPTSEAYAYCEALEYQCVSLLIASTDRWLVIDEAQRATLLGNNMRPLLG